MLQNHSQAHSFGLKRATTTTPPEQHCGAGERGAFYAALKICLKHSHYHQKLIKNDVLYGNKKFAEIFCETFLIIKIYFV
jgi:hypothetical protein